MLENRMVIDSEWPEEKASHWDEDRDSNLVEDFAEDEDIIYPALQRWLGCDEAYETSLDRVFEWMPASLRERMLEEYIEANNLECKFDEWWEERYRGGDE